MKKNLDLFFAKLSLSLHNLAYRLSGRFAVRAEGGLHPKHRLMQYHGFFVDNINKGETVLDIGCGNGSLAFDLAQKAGKVVAIDINASNIMTAKKRYPADNIQYIHGDATEYKLADGFDSIVLSNVLEHIEKRVEFLKKVKGLAPRILIRVPMMDRDWITLYKKELGIEWRLDKTHHVEYTLESFIREIEEAGLKLTSHSIQFGEIWGELRD